LALTAPKQRAAEVSGACCGLSKAWTIRLFVGQFWDFQANGPCFFYNAKIGNQLPQLMRHIGEWS